MAPAAREEDSRLTLVVEGFSDLCFFAELLEHIGFQMKRAPREIFIRQLEGRSGLRAKLETYLTPQLLSMKDAIAIVVDADEDPRAAFESVRAVVQAQCGFAPTEPGTWSNSKPKVGIHVVPSAKRKGAIETLVWDSFCGTAQLQQATACVTTFLECMANAGHTPKNADKARIGAVLSVLHDEDPRLGPGTQARKFDLDHASLGELRQFLAGFRVT